MGRSKTPVITDENGNPFYGSEYIFAPGKGDWLRRGDAATIVTYGAVTPSVMEAWRILQEDGISVGVINMASLLPLDKDILLEAATKSPIMTVEDHHVDTGLGVSAATVLMEAGIGTKLRRLGVHHYGGSGKPAELYAEQGLDAASIAESLKELIA
jgi:transketolase